MNKKVKILSILLTAIVGTGCSSTSTSSVVNEAAKHLVVRHVLRQNATDNTGAILNVTEAPVANNVVSDVLAQVNTPENDKVNIRFVAGIDSYAYGSASFNITLKDSEGTVVKEERSYAVSSAYLGVEVEGETVYATNTEYFGEGCNYLIAYTLTDVPEDYWNYQFDVTASVGETGKSANVKTKVASEMVDYNVKVNMFNVDGTKLGSKYEKVAVDSLYTVTAPEVEGLVASHDYVKGYLTEGKTTHNIYYSEVDVWDGSSVSASFEEAGTEADPYLISSAADFALLKQQAAEGNTYEGYYFKMTKSVDFGGANFMVSTFEGVFDGNNCSVRGLAIENNVSYTGLFSKTTAGEIKNISTYGEVYGLRMVGSIVGQTSGLLTNCTNYAHVNGDSSIGGIAGTFDSPTINNCINYGTVSAKTGSVSGIVYSPHYVSLNNCINYGDISSDTGWVTGIGGTYVYECKNYGKLSVVNGNVSGISHYITKNDSIISKCINYGYIYIETSGTASGIVYSFNYGEEIFQCINYGNIFGNVNEAAGIVFIGARNIKQCINYGDIVGNKTASGIIAHDYDTDRLDGVKLKIENCVNNGQIKSVEGISGGILGIADSTNYIYVNDSINNGKIITGGSNAGQIIGYVDKNSTTQLRCNVSNCSQNGEVLINYIEE